MMLKLKPSQEGTSSGTFRSLFRKFSEFSKPEDAANFRRLIAAARCSNTTFHWREQSQGDYAQFIHGFTLVDPARVRRYVRERPALDTILVEARSELSRFFPDARVKLKISVDQETGDEQLFADVYTSLSVPEALQQLDAFDEAWYLDKAKEVDWCFNVKLQYE